MAGPTLWECLRLVFWLNCWDANQAALEEKVVPCTCTPKTFMEAMALLVLRFDNYYTAHVFLHTNNLLQNQ